MRGKQKREKTQEPGMSEHRREIRVTEKRQVSDSSPEATDHPELRALISAATLQGFSKPRHFAPVRRVASGTEVRKHIRSRARSRGSIERREESSTKQILALSVGEEGRKERKKDSKQKTENRKSAQDGETEDRENTAMCSEQNGIRETISRRAGSSSIS